MKKLYLLIFAVSFLFAQNQNLQIKYPEKNLPLDDSKLFCEGTVSINGRYEYGFSISPDGKSIVFGTEEEGASKIYIMNNINDKWTEPKILQLTNGKKKNEMEAFFSPNGKYIYFAAFDEFTDLSLYCCEIVDGEFLEAKKLESPIGETRAFYPVVSKSNILYYSDIMKARINCAEVQGSKVLNHQENVINGIIHFFISPDEKFALVDYAKNRKDPKDIYIIYKNGDGSWGELKKLNSKINTEYSETCPSISPDGKYIFFSRYNEDNEVSNIYWVSLDLVLK